MSKLHPGFANAEHWIASLTKPGSSDVAAQQFGHHHQHFAELPHDFCLYFGKLPSARAAVDSISESFQLPVCASA